MWESLAATGTLTFALVDPTLGVAQDAPVSQKSVPEEIGMRHCSSGMRYGLEESLTGKDGKDGKDGRKENHVTDTHRQSRISHWRQ